MPLDLWLAYALASTILVLIPGPTVMLVVTYALSEGRRAAWSTVAGVGLGDVTALVCSLAGLGAILATSAEAFVILKWCGAAYLVWLGIKLFRAEPRIAEPAPGEIRPSQRRLLWHAWVVTALNPKGIVFFVAFLPQFVSPERPLLPQLLILGTTFVVIAMVNAAAYALLASHVRGFIRRPSVMRWVNRTGGCVLVGAGVTMAALRRA